MLTITTNKTEVQGISEGRITSRDLPITDYWTKRIIRLLDFPDSDEREIMHNLREGRSGTTDARREVVFTAGGVMSVTVSVTISIGQRDGIEKFVLKIWEVLERRGDLSSADPVETLDDQDVEVIGNPNAPVVSKLVQKMGFCKYCNSGRFVQVPENASPADINEQASNECDCDEAVRQRERRQRMEAAGAWAQNTFSRENGQLQVILCAIRSTFEGAIDFVTVKIGKRKYRIDTDRDGMIRIREEYRDSNEETF